MSDNRLQVLLIHDSDFVIRTPSSILGTPDLALCRVKRTTGEAAYVQTWECVLEILVESAQVATRPDILLVDARFEKDATAPPLFLTDSAAPHGSPHGGPADDPRGLVYGAVLAAYFGGGRASPLGFAPYSRDLPGLASDGHALAAYGLLAALTGELRNPDGNSAVRIRREVLETAVGGTPEDGWPLALERFRSSLWIAISEGMVRPDALSFAAARDALRRAVAAGEEPEEGMLLEWTEASGRSRRVLLSSLFADCRDARGWALRRLRSLAAERINDIDTLAELANKAAWVDERARRVVAVLRERVESEERWVVPNAKQYSDDPGPWSGGQDGYWEQCAGLLVLRALNLADLEQQRRRRRVRAATKLSEKNATQLGRCLRLGVGHGSVDKRLRYMLGSQAFGTAFGSAEDISLPAVIAAAHGSARWPSAWPVALNSIVKSAFWSLVSEDDYLALSVPPWVR